MTRYFQTEVEKLKKRVLYLTAMVEENLQSAVLSVTRRDADLARQVIAKDEEIDHIEVELEEECLKILALHQPVAIDLRFIVAALKINNDLERIGDMAVNIAERALDLIKMELRPVPFDLPRMLSQSIAVVKKSADALVDQNTTLAYEVCIQDDLLDDLHRQAYAAVKKNIREHPELSEFYISLLSISRNLERIGDHATNIAEDVIYMVTGEIIRHKGGNNTSMNGK